MLHPPSCSGGGGGDNGSSSVGSGSVVEANTRGSDGAAGAGAGGVGVVGGSDCLLQLGDVRSWDEYIGVSHDYTYFDALGRIPGAQWLEWGQVIDFL